MAWIRNARSKKDQLSSGNKSANSWFLFNLEIQFQICRSFHFQFQISSFGYLTGKFNNNTDKYRNMKLLNSYWSLIVLRRHCRGDLNFLLKISATSRILKICQTWCFLLIIATISNLILLLSERDFRSDRAWLERRTRQNCHSSLLPENE